MTRPEVSVRMGGRVVARRLQDRVGVDLVLPNAGVMRPGPARLLGQRAGLVDDRKVRPSFREMGEGGGVCPGSRRPAQGVEIVGPGAVARRPVGDDEALAEVDVLAPGRDGEGNAPRDRPLDVEIIEEDLMPIEGPVLGGQVDAELVGGLAQDLEVLHRTPAQAQGRPVAGVSEAVGGRGVEVDGVVPGLESEPLDEDELEARGGLVLGPGEGGQDGRREGGETIVFA
jgi:hypothetical protein